jgi:hypothetical protein
MPHKPIFGSRLRHFAMANEIGITFSIDQLVSFWRSKLGPVGIRVSHPLALSFPLCLVFFS